MRSAAVASAIPAPLWAVNLLTFLVSIGTGVVWNGISFIVEEEYHFTKPETLGLYAVMGMTYVLGAFTTSRVLSFVESWLSPRGVLGMILVVKAVICAGPAFVREPWIIWVIVCVDSIASSWLWPIVESYVTAGRHGTEMRRAIGWWNLSWTSAVGLALLVMAPLMTWQPRMAIVLLGGLNAVALAPLWWLDRRPGVHDTAQSTAAIQSEYPLLLRAARILLPLSYVLNSAMAPVIPYLLTSMNVEIRWKTPCTATWMFARVLTMAVMWRLQFWHGRWGTLLLGAIMMSLGFGLIVAAFSLWITLAGLVVFGVGMGMVYYAALYYAMAVGHAEVDAGGTHEGLIGVGYTIGPIAGFAGLGITHAMQDAGSTLRFEWVVVGIVWMLIAIGALGAVRLYLRARKMRR